MLIHRDDGRYAHMPGCNERCGEDGHWLQQASPAPWQAGSLALWQEDETPCP